MAGRLSRRLRRAVAVVAAVTVSATGLTLAAAGGPARAQAGADVWQPCSSAAANGRIERVEILLALDRSGSLQGVDPDGTKRRRAVHLTRERLVLLQESVSELLGGSGFGIDVALVAFDTEGRTLAGFAPVGADHPSDSAIEAALVAGRDTDYGPAVEQALEQFENSPTAGSATTCRILVLFTDGILDPYDTAAGRSPALEDRAAAHVSNLLDDLCGNDPGLRRHRQQMADLGVSTYVAVVRGPAFARGAGGSHLDFLARSSKQMILAVTGHGDSPLLGGVTAASGCESWSDVRAGKVIEIEDIGDLTGELANAVGEVGLAVRQPRIRCSRESPAEADLVGDWPHRLALVDRSDASLCKVTPPLDGEVVLTVGGSGLPPEGEWQIDDMAEGVPRSAVRRLTAGDADLPFNIASSLLPEDDPVGFVADAAVEIVAIWYPELQSAWPEQPTEVPLATTTLRFDVPDREAYWVERLIDCRVHRRASWADVAGGTRAEAAGLCTVKAPPAGDFAMVLKPSNGNRLEWRPSRMVGGNLPEELPRTELIILAAGSEGVSLGALSQVLDPDEVPLGAIEDGVVFELTWRSASGAVLVSRPVPDSGVRVEVSPTSVDLLECDAEAQVTAARQDAEGEWALVVDTGCRLPSPPQGAVRATASGDVRGAAWRLVDPPPPDADSWPIRDDVVVASSEEDRTLFIGVGSSGLADLIGAEVEFTLVANWSAGGSSALDEQREPRTVTVYLPVIRCEPRVDAVRVDVEPSEGGEAEQRARVANLCQIDPPPNGRLGVRTADAPPGPELSWQPVRDGDAVNVLIVEPEDDPVSLDVLSGLLSPSLLAPFESGIDVYLNWDSAGGYASGSGRRVVAAVHEEAPELLDCSGEPGALRSGAEVPEVPLIVDTGCVLPVPEVGVVTLGVEGSVAGVNWRLPGPVSLAPGDADRPILIESAGTLPNEPLAAAPSFELVATLTFDGYEPPADRRQRVVTVQLERRIRIRCTGTPHVVGAPIEVPEGPLVVDTGCTLLAPGAGTVTVRPTGEFAGVPWGLAGEIRLSPGDDDLPILIETTAPLPNRRYETVAEFALAAVWLSPDGLEQNVGEQPPPGQASPMVAVELRARPSTGTAVLIVVVLLVAGLLLGWLVLWVVGRWTNRLPRSGEYRFIRREVRLVVTQEGKVDLPDFGAASALTGDSKPLVRRRGKLLADGLALHARVQWWNPRGLLDGGRVEAVPQEKRDLLVALSPSSGGPNHLDSSLAPGAVVVALDRSPTVSTPEANEHLAQIWILIQSAGPRNSTEPRAQNEQNAVRNLRRALDALGKRLSGGPSGDDPSQPSSGVRRPPPRQPRPKG